MPLEPVVEQPKIRSLRDFYYVLFRHRLSALVAFSGVMALVLWAAFLRDREYRSEAKLLVRVGRESVGLDPTATTGQVTSVRQSRTEEVSSELQILSSTELLQQVVREVGLVAAGPETSEAELVTAQLEAVEELAEDLTFEVLQDSSVIVIRFDHEDPELARSVVDQLVAAYLSKHLAVHQTPGSYEFFSSQSENLAEQLRQSEDTLRDLRNSAGISSTVAQRRLLLERISAREQSIQELEARIESSGSQLAFLQRLLGVIPENLVLEESRGMPNAAADRLRERLFELRLEAIALVEQFGDESRPLQPIRSQIHEAQTLLQQQEFDLKQVTEGVNSIHQKAQMMLLTERAELLAAQTQVKGLKSHLLEDRAALAGLDQDGLDIARLERQVELHEDSFRRYAESLEQARIDHALQAERISNIRVIQQATLPVEPLGPGQVFMLLAGLVASVFAALGLPLVVACCDDAIHTPQDAEWSLRVPVLASLPRTDPESLDRENGHAQGWVVPAPLRSGCENLRNTVVANGTQRDPGPKIVAVTSCRSAAGTSTVASCLAHTLAGIGQDRVLLIDASSNGESPAQDSAAGHPFDPAPRSSPGAELDEADPLFVLADPSSHEFTPEGGATVQRWAPRSLSVISAGDAAEQLRSDDFPYDWVVLDLPPVSEIPASARLAGICDEVIMVVEASRSRAPVASRAKEQLQQSKAPLLGVVVNKRRFPIPRWLYQTL